MVPPDVERVEFTFNDATTDYISYVLESPEEILYNYKRSWGRTPYSKSNIDPYHVQQRRDNYGMGLPFGSFQDLSKNKLGLNIRSAISSTNKYGVYMFFRGMVQV